MKRNCLKINIKSGTELENVAEERRHTQTADTVIGFKINIRLNEKFLNSK